jgi:hypothetical protein
VSYLTALDAELADLEPRLTRAKNTFQELKARKVFLRNEKWRIICEKFPTEPDEAVYLLLLYFGPLALEDLRDAFNSYTGARDAANRLRTAGRIDQGLHYHLYVVDAAE